MQTSSGLKQLTYIASQHHCGFGYYRSYTQVFHTVKHVSMHLIG